MRDWLVQKETVAAVLWLRRYSFALAKKNKIDYNGNVKMRRYALLHFVYDMNIKG